MSNDYNNKRYYWIKLKDTFFTSDTVDFLMSQKDGANYVVLYQMLCLKTANTNGELSRQLGEIIVPFDIDKIHRDCKYFSIDTIRVALELYKKLGLIYEQENGILQITNFANLIGSESQNAVYKRQHRAEEKRLESVQENSNKILDIRDKILDIRDIEKESIYDSIKNAYNNTCVLLPKCTVLSDKRKKAIKCRVDTYGFDKVMEAFGIVSKSDFLNGKNNKDWKANFDWIMNDTNMAKILDGNYDKTYSNETTQHNTSKNFDERTYSQEKFSEMITDIGKLSDTDL